MTADETLAHPQTAALNVVREVGDGKMRVRAFPARYSRLRPRLHATAPRLGEHTEAIAAEAGFTTAAAERMLAAAGKDEG